MESPGIGRQQAEKIIDMPSSPVIGTAGASSPAKVCTAASSALSTSPDSSCSRISMRRATTAGTRRPSARSAKMSSLCLLPVHWIMRSQTACGTAFSSMPSWRVDLLQQAFAQLDGLVQLGGLEVMPDRRARLARADERRATPDSASSTAP